MDICFERYFELSRDEYSKIKKFIDNNIDTFESTLASIHGFVDLYRYYQFNFHSIKNYNKCFCIIERYNYGLRNIMKSYLNVEYIKFFYLLQKVTKLSISNINSRILKNMFINFYDNSNIDCNEKVESKIYDLYREIIKYNAQ